jgi:hypothetical protein
VIEQPSDWGKCTPHSAQGTITSSPAFFGAGLPLGGKGDLGEPDFLDNQAQISTPMRPKNRKRAIAALLAQ